MFIDLGKFDEIEDKGCNVPSCGVFDEEWEISHHREHHRGRQTLCVAVPKREKEAEKCKEMKRTRRGWLESNEFDARESLKRRRIEERVDSTDADGMTVENSAKGIIERIGVIFPSPSPTRGSKRERAISFC